CATLNRKSCFDAPCMTSQVLPEKAGVAFGAAIKRRIAWAITKAWAAAGSRIIFNYQGERLKENVADLVGEFGENVPLLPCDVSSDEKMARFFQEVRGQTEVADLFLDIVGVPPQEELYRDFVTAIHDAELVGDVI